MTVLDDVRQLSDEALLDAYRAAGDDAAAWALLDEAERRDLADRTRAAREALAVIRAEGELAAHAQYLAASEWTRGRLLSREGEAAGITDETVLWRLPEARATRYASEELNDYWLYVEPRITAAGYVRQRAAAMRIARAEALEAAGIEGVEISDEEGGTDEYDEAGAEGPGLVDDEPGSLRLEPVAEDAAGAGRAGGAVLGGGRGAQQGKAGGQAGAGAGWPGRPAEPAGGVMTAFTTFAEITPCEPEWVWQGRVPCGTVTVLAAPGGAGKSFFAADLAARVSRGDLMPDGTPGARPAPVIYVGLEDSPEASTVHRLTAARAELGNVIDASEGPSGAPFDVTEDLPWLREVNDRAGGARLVVVDTLSAASPVSLTAVATVRNQILRPLLAFAKDTGAAVLAVHHVTKAGSVAGSKAIEDGVRQVLTISRDTADPRVRSVRVHKTNVASDELPDVRYTLAGQGRDTAVSWLCDIGQHHGRGPASNGQARVLMLLRNTTAPMSAQEIAAKTGISCATVWVLLHRLGSRGLVTSPARNAYTASPAA